MVRPGVVGRGKAGPGAARQGMAGRGVAWRGRVSTGRIHPTIWGGASRQGASARQLEVQGSMGRALHIGLRDRPPHNHKQEDTMRLIEIPRDFDDEELHKLAKEADRQLDDLRQRVAQLEALEARLATPDDQQSETLAEICKRANRALAAVSPALDAAFPGLREALPESVPTIAVPVATLQRWQTMIRDIAYEIEFDGDCHDRWVYNVGQAYADANVVSIELANRLRENSGG